MPSSSGIEIIQQISSVAHVRRPACCFSGLLGAIELGLLPIHVVHGTQDFQEQIFLLAMSSAALVAQDSLLGSTVS
jgi:hypothetical protein